MTAQQMPALQTSSSHYEHPSMQPLSAVPFSPYVDQYSVLAMVTMQLEYYFSIDNLCKDLFLRKHMDTQGFVLLAFIAGFKRIQALTQDIEMLRHACQESMVVEVVRGDDGIDRLRRREAWEKWVLNVEERDETARNAGPARYQHLPGPRAPSYGPMIMPGQQAMSPQQFSPPLNDNGFQSYNDSQPGKTSGFAEDYKQHLDTPLSAAVPEFAPGKMILPQSNSEMNAETTFTDAEVENLELVFAMPKSADDSSQSRHAARTLSNGSLAHENGNPKGSRDGSLEK